MCTPLTYDSRNQGSQRGRSVVHIGGVAAAMIAAIVAAASAARTRNREARAIASTCGARGDEREADDVQNVHPQQVGSWRVGLAEQKLL